MKIAIIGGGASGMILIMLILYTIMIWQRVYIENLIETIF